MGRRVFFHVGAPKSGTTYLQERFRANADLLATQGISYVPSASVTHFLPALDLIQRRWGGELRKAAGAWDAFAATAKATPGDLLISHEILAGANPAQVQRARAAFPNDELHVVYTARDLARQVPAEWQESLKHRAKAPYARFLKRLREYERVDSDLWFWRVQNISDVLTRWGDGLPPSQLHLVVVPPPGKPRDALWRRMCAVLGVDPTLDYADTDTQNPSIGIAGASVLRRLNQLLLPKDLGRADYVRLVREVVVGEVLSQRKDLVRATVPGRRRPFFEQVAEEHIEWAQESGIDVVGDLEDLRPRWPEGPVPHPDRPDPQVVADAAIAALARMVEEAADRGHAEPKTAAERRLRTRLAEKIRRSTTLQP